MLKAIWFALHFAIIMIGAIITIHFDIWLGLAIMLVFAVKFAFMIPNTEEL